MKMIKIPQYSPTLVFESIFKNNSNFWCLCPSETIKHDLEDRFIVIINQEMKLKKLRLGQGYLQYSDNKFMDITNVEMSMTNNALIESRGFRLTKNKMSIEIYGNIDNWVEYLKPYVIQFYFQQKYQILQKLEKGTLKGWYNVKNKITHSEYSVLIIEKNQELKVELLKKNVQLLRTLKINSLVKMREIFESRNQIFILFDQISGNHIDEFKFEKQLTENDISIIMRYLFTTLEYLHLNNITLGKKADIINLYLKNPKDWKTIYPIDFIDMQRNYENNNQFYEQAQQDVYNFGIIFQYLLDYNTDAAKLFSYEKQEWSKQAFDLYQKLNDHTLQFSSYDALQHPFIIDHSNVIVGSFSSRNIFFMSELGIQQLEISTGLNSSQNISQSPPQSNSPKKSQKKIKISKFLSHNNSPRQNENISTHNSIDINSIIEKYSQINNSDLIIDNQQIPNQTIIQRQSALSRKRISILQHNEQNSSQTPDKMSTMRSQKHKLSVFHQTSIQLNEREKSYHKSPIKPQKKLQKIQLRFKN